MRPANPTFIRYLLPLLFWLSTVLLATTAQARDSFILAVIPDTQNYVDFRHQLASEFEFDAADLFIEQMRYIASNAVANGGKIAFVASVGDVWQHQTIAIDPEHRARGMEIEPDPILAKRAVRTEEVLEIEIPKAIEGYRLISEAGLPFGVAPGNHDYDAAWSVAGFPPDRNKEWSEMTRTVEDLGLLHVGGLDNFRRAFGADSDFFRDRPWYVASFRGGANSAQRFHAAGYDFLHIAIEMQADDAVFAWIESVLAEHPGLPTILTTHDYLDRHGERNPQPLVDLVRADPQHHNSAEQLWQQLIRKNDQIFLVLSGHHPGQSYRLDNNLAGNPVYQILADYQVRGQAAVDHGRKSYRGIGDGWMRLMKFDFSEPRARLRVRTYSSYYRHYSSHVDNYARWYREREQPGMTDSEFLAADDFVIFLDGFRERFASN